MENRGREYHYERLGEAMREEISAIIEGELADPRIGLATVTEVQVSPDGKSAHVLVNVIGEEEDERSTIAGLDTAKGYIKREVGMRLRLRHVPELYFRLDRSTQHETRINVLLDRVNKRKKG